MRRIIATGALAIALAFGSALPASATFSAPQVIQVSDDDVVIPTPAQLAETGVSAGDRALLGLGLVGGGLLVIGAIVFAVKH